MKIRYFIFILIGVYWLSNTVHAVGPKANDYLFRSQVKIEEFNNFSKKGLGHLAARSLNESKDYLERLAQIKHELSQEQLNLLNELHEEVTQKEKIEAETISTCDYRNIEHYKEIEKLKELKVNGSILTFRSHKNLYLLKAKEVQKCQQFSTWMENFNEISV
ncbi:hypothetical protein [Halobacteriovorax sp. RT-1-4]|uniref:hypothetical protein n=1 Tax=unclassified Halobacteriovorax TaxID=2639665 RepID=UPI00399BFFFB